MAGGDIPSELVAQWADEFSSTQSVKLQDDGTLSTTTADPQLIAPLTFRAAEAA
jgi:hypothetical protein